MRVAEGKEKVIVLDFVSDIRRFAAGLSLKDAVEDYEKTPVRLNLPNKVTFMKVGGEDPDTSIDAEYGIQNSGFSAPTVKMMQEQNRASANFVLWIDKQLKAHGVCENLYIDCGLNTAFLLTEPNKIRNGSYMWEPAISPATKKSSESP